MKKKKGFIYKITVLLVKVFYKKRKFIGVENILEDSCLIIGNHAQLHGPLACELFFPSNKRIWCIGEMMNIKEVPSYSYKDFWMYKPKFTKWFYKLISYIIAIPASYYLSNADTIAVYKDVRLLKTFKDTIKELETGNNIIIFPECHDEFNEIVNEFQDKFVDVARLYYKKTGKEISFVPMYNAAKIKTIVFGKPIKYDHTIDMEVQRKIVCDYLKNEITVLAKNLPVHKVIPFNNIKKKYYKNSK